MLSKDLRELLASLNAAGAEFLVVGDHAVAFHRVAARLDDADVWMISREDLIRNKRETGRTQDLADAEFLERFGG
jgi:predicted nucleotidyltransferase